VVKLQVNSGELRVTGGSTGGSSQSVHSIFPFQEGARASKLLKLTAKSHEDGCAPAAAPGITHIACVSCSIYDIAALQSTKDSILC
jgi:hypothetical protein